MTFAPINNTSLDLNLILIAGVRSDHLLHIFIFFPFFLLVRLIKGVNYYSSLKQVFFWILIGLCIASCVELIQLFIPAKSFTISDLTSNVIGIMLGSFVFFIKLRDLGMERKIA
jgi:VanZ family protein